MLDLILQFQDDLEQEGHGKVDLVRMRDMMMKLSSKQLYAVNIGATIYALRQNMLLRRTRIKRAQMD